MEVNKALPEKMQAMVLEKKGGPLLFKNVPMPRYSDKQVLVKVRACGICRTDLHILDGELNAPKLPLIPGHEIIGEVVRVGAGVTGLKAGDVVGIPWLAYTCDTCKYCLEGKENLCANALFTGYTLDGGYAEYTAAYESYCFPFLGIATPAAAPLLCAGLIGYRSYRMMHCAVKDVGIYGFGVAAHIITQVAVFQQKKVYAFTKDGDTASQQFALRLGAVWAGDASKVPPQLLDAAIIFAPVGDLIPKALKDVDKGGLVVCGGIYMSDIPSFPYSLLWGERVIHSVANLTRQDGIEFLKLAPQIPVKTETHFFPLHHANEALEALRNGILQGAAVLVMP